MPSSAAPDHPITVVLPGSPGAPTIIDYRPAGLRLAIVDRTNINLLDERWDTPGNYILLDPLQSGGAYEAYVGKAPAGLKARLRNHVSGKQHWIRALLVARDSYHGYNSAEVSCLEGRLYDRLHASPAVTLSNRQRPRDETLPAYERTMLEFAIDPVERVLALIGYGLSLPSGTLATRLTPDEALTPISVPIKSAVPVGPVMAPVDTALFDVPGKPQGQHAGRRFPKKSRPVRYQATLLDLLNAGLVTAGQTLVSPEGRQRTSSATVLVSGEVSWNGATYPTLSAAASAAMGRNMNGWTHWRSVVGGGKPITLFDLRAQYMAGRDPAAG